MLKKLASYSMSFRVLTLLINSHVNPCGIFKLDMETRLPIEMDA